MVLSYNFIKKYFNCPYSPQEVYDLFTKHSIEIDRMFKISDINGIVTGKIISIVKHPKSEKLNICNVDYGSGIKKIICGADNVYENMISAVAPIGTKFSSDFVIGEREMLGEVSMGMLCSFNEIVNIDVNCEKYNDGIIDFGTDIDVGLDVTTLLSLDDYIYELGITPNRVDLLNFIGQILEIKAVFKEAPKLFDFDFDYDRSIELKETKIDLKITDKDQDICDYFNITHIKLKDFGLTYNEEYLLLINNINLVNKVVDLGNYAMLVSGQPVNFYDAKKVNANEIKIRRAVENEEFIGLDKKLINLTSDDIVISAQNRVLSLAGIMCSNEFKIDENTEEVLLEIARFNPKMIRKTASKHNLRSDSSFRFERGISREATFDVNSFIKRYLQKNGCVISQEKTISNLNLEETKIEFTLNDLNATLGLVLTLDEVKYILELLTLDFELDNEIFNVSVSLRHNNFTIKEDIYEEIIRIYGYDKIIPKLPNVDSIKPLNKFEKTSRFVKEFLVSNGFNQVLTYSLVSEKQNQVHNHTFFDNQDIKLGLPLSKDREYLRNNLTSSLIQTLELNYKNQARNIQIFEIGEIFSKTFNNSEKQMLNICVCGDLFDSFNKNNSIMDFYYVKSILGRLCTKLNLNIDNFEFKTNNLALNLHPYQSANIFYKDQYVGYIGNVLNKKIKNIYTLEIDFDFLVENYSENLEIKEFSQLPSTTKDFSVVCSREINYQEIKEKIISLNIDLIKNIQIKDEFASSDTEKSILIRITINDFDKPLTEEKISKIYKKVLNKLNEKYMVK